MKNTALELSHRGVSQELSQPPRVRELARDAVCLMAFSVGVSVALMCGILAMATLVH